MFKVELVEGDSSFQDIEKWYNTMTTIYHSFLINSDNQSFNSRIGFRECKNEVGCTESKEYVYEISKRITA